MILVIGGAGFIGSAVFRHLIRHTEDSAANFDKLTYAGNLESLAEVKYDRLCLLYLASGVDGE